MAHIIVIGAGIGGMSAAYELRGELGNSHRITVIGDGPRFSFNPSNPWLAVGWRTPPQIQVEVGPYLAKKQSQFVPEAATPTDAACKLVTTPSGTGLSFDDLLHFTSPRLAFQETPGAIAKGISDRVDHLCSAFRRIVFSQLRISALNTFLTAIYLVVILPLTGTDLPLTKTMIAVTFFAGLLPIIGNLISNTVIVLISLSISPLVALGSLTFLVVIHKLEYFANAHIIGTQIRARAWELLIAMLVMESAFGIAGLIAAPIYYAYLKDELTSQKLI